MSTLTWFCYTVGDTPYLRKQTPRKTKLLLNLSGDEATGKVHNIMKRVKQVQYQRDPKNPSYEELQTTNEKKRKGLNKVIKANKASQYPN